MMKKNKQIADDNRDYHKMASRSIAPPSLLTTSRRLIEQLEIFEKDIVQCKDHQAVQDFPNHFAVVKQAMLAVKNSQDGVTSGLERFEPNSVLSHQLPEEFLVEEPPPTCYRIVPTQSIEIVGVPYVHSDDMQISPRDPNGWPTLRAARNHLLWKRFPTPLTSVFSDKSRALDWARMLETRHEEVQFVLVEINTSSLPHALLYDATKLAKYLDLPTFRIDYHHGESFLLGPIDRRYIAQKSPITRGRRLEQRIDSTMLDSFDLMNQEAIKYASDTPGKQSRRNEPGQKAGKSQAPQQAGSEYGREDSTVGEVGLNSARYVHAHHSAN